MFGKLADSLLSHHDLEHQGDLYRKLLRHEARIGGTVFGPLPPGRRREFFCLDEHTWVWHEEWPDKYGRPRYITTRYDIRPDGIVKSQNGSYVVLNEDEAKHLVQAARRYRQKIYDDLYEPLLEKAKES